MVIRKGEVFLADLEPKRGTEPGKVRPVVVIQTNLLNGIHPSTVICPITTKVQPRAIFLRVHLAVNEASLKQKSDILVDQIRAIDNRRLIKRLGKISRQSQSQLANNLSILLS
jgi:mRNA interferase MazF